MPVRIRITLIFSMLVFVILSLVCGGIYYFSYQSRINNIMRRLTNRAITTARLLSQREIFDRGLVERIDSSTTISLKDKAVDAFDRNDRHIYRYSDLPNDTMHITPELIRKTRDKGSFFFAEGEKEIIGYRYSDNNSDIAIFVAAEDIDGRTSLSDLSRILLLSFLIGNILVWISGYLFSRGLLMPVTKITDDVAEISAQNLARRIKTGTARDEWFHLADTLNNLLNRLQDSFEMQRRFISNASHELSTPLTAISSQLEVSLQRPRSEAEYRAVLQSIYQDVQQLTKLTQTLLEFAKASGDPGGLEINLVRMDEVLMNIPAELSRIQPGYTATLAFTDLPEQDDDLLVFGNEALLLTAINNIVINACKYSPDHHASIGLRTGPGLIWIDIRDAGPGIPEEEIAKIFQPFYRTEDQGAVRGFGLGLSLAQRIIKIHKGDIQVASEPGQGTHFQIRLSSAKSLPTL